MSAVRWNAVALGLSFLACAAAPSAASTDAGEYEVKAAYLYNFGKFVQYPAGAWGPDESFTICVAGVDPFQGALGVVLKDALIGTRRVRQRHVEATADLAGCQILFLGDSLQPQVVALLASLSGQHVLTVSEIPQFVNRGGMIQFVTQGGRVRFEINLAAAHSAGLTLSADLLRVASAVRRQP